MSIRTLGLTAALSVVLPLCDSAFGISGIDRIASRGQVARGPSCAGISSSRGGERIVTEADPWPNGVFELVNDSLRTNGFYSWFSELPNDVDFFLYEIRSVRDANHLIRKLSEVEAPSLELRLTSAISAQPSAHSSPVAVEFSIGNQAILRHWYEDLPVDDSGGRKFGVHRYTECPVATPPTLTLYVGNPAIDLSKLHVPENVKVVAEPRDEKWNVEAEAETRRAIKEFVEARRRGMPVEAGR